MAAGGILEDFVLEFFTCGLERFYQMLYFEDVYILVAGVGVDQKRRLELFGVPCRGTAAVFVHIGIRRFADVVIGFVEVSIILSLIPHPGDKIADGNTCIGDLVILRMIKNIKQSDESAVAPAEDAHTALVHEIVVLDHVIPSGIHILDLQSSIVDEFVHAASVARASPVLRSDDDVALSHQLSNDVGIVGAEVAVDASVREDEEGIFL